MNRKRMEEIVILPGRNFWIATNTVGVVHTWAPDIRRTHRRGEDILVPAIRPGEERQAHLQLYQPTFLLPLEGCLCLHCAPTAKGSKEASSLTQCPLPRKEQGKEKSRPQASQHKGAHRDHAPCSNLEPCKSSSQFVSNGAACQRCCRTSAIRSGLPTYFT